MRAAFYRSHGEARAVLEVADLPLPEPGPAEVRVRVYASGVNPSDVKGRGGLMSSTMPYPLIVPHSDGAGLVEAVGPGVDSARIGERVWLWNAQFRRAWGTAAEFVVVPDVQAVVMPAVLSYEEAACLGVPALTAYRAVTLGAQVAGQWVLVSGGAGAVGHYAVQIAKRKGARVIATASTPERMRHAQEAGAEHVIDYRAPSLESEVLDLTNGAGVARVIEVEYGLNANRVLSMLQQEGTIYVYGSAAAMTPQINVQQLMVKGASLHFRSVYLMPLPERQAAIADLTAMMADGQLVHAVGEVLPLTAIASAHEQVETRAIVGNVVLSI